MTEHSSVLLDTSVVIAHLRGEPAVTDHLMRTRAFVPLTVIGELHFGACNSSNPSKNMASIRSFLESCRVLLLTERTAELYGQIKTELELAGKRIPENDVWIAAVAKEHGLPLVTRDRHFLEIAECPALSW